MNKITGIIIVLIFFTSCSGDYIPKPTGYFRIDFPEKKYVKYDSFCPFTFEYPAYAHIEKSEDTLNDLCSFNIVFSKFRAVIYLTYKVGRENISGYLEESHKFVYKHTIKADAINEKLYIDSASHVFGTLFEIKGNAASSIQFHMTDSAGNFLRGSLYFDNVPNKDSLQPVIRFLQTDISHLIETLEWKN